MGMDTDGGSDLSMRDASISARGMAVICFALVLASNISYGWAQYDLRGGQLATADDYVRVSRVADLISGRNGWFDGSLHWSNTPFGTTIHWTRPLDALIVALATPMRLVLDRDDAVFWGGVLSAPLLSIALACTIWWAARAIVSDTAAWLAALIALFQPAVFSYTKTSIVDHHALLIIVFCALLGTALRAAGRTASDRLMAAAGVVAALGVWVSPEAHMGVALLITTLAVTWAIDGSKRARHLLVFAVAWFAGLGGALVLERGTADVWTFEYDQISLHHMVLAGSFAVAVSVVAMVEQRSTMLQSSTRRFAALAGVAVATVALMAAAGTNMLTLARAPYSTIPDDIREFWLTRLGEFTGAGAAGVATATVFLALPFLGGVAAWLMSRHSPVADRNSWLVAVAWTVATVVISLAALRLAVYPEVVGSIGISGAAWKVSERWNHRLDLRASIARVSIVVLAVLGYLIPVILVSTLAPSGRNDGPASAPTNCDVRPVVEAIDVDEDPLPAVLTQLDLAPVLHLDAGVDVVGTGHHRNERGIRAVRDTFRASPEVALKEVTERGIDYVAICSSIGDLFMDPIPAESLYDVLDRRQPPPWLVEVPTSSSETTLWRVVPG